MVSAPFVLICELATMGSYDVISHGSRCLSGKLDAIVLSFFAIAPCGDGSKLVPSPKAERTATSWPRQSNKGLATPRTPGRRLPL